MTEPVSPAASPHDVPSKPAAVEHEWPIRRILRFGGIAGSILLLVNAFVCATFGFFFNLPGWAVWQLVPGALSIAFIATSIVGYRVSHPLLRAAYAVSAAWLGLLNFAFFAAVACRIAGGIAALFGQMGLLERVGPFFFGLALVTTVYGLANAARLRTTRVTVALPHLPESWRGRTIALISDLHLGQVAGPGFVRRITARLRALRPDAVLISGDMFDGSPLRLDELVAPWRDYSAPRGVYFVTGNHDEFADRRLFIDAVKRTGIRVLNNEKVDVEGLQIVGVHDEEATEAEELRAILKSVDLDPQRPSLLLAHQPMNLRVAEEAGISLQLSGHTHGGQIWPWNGVVSRIFGRFAYGLNKLGSLQVFTSNGAGTWGPPLRLGTRSEVVLIRLEI